MPETDLAAALTRAVTWIRRRLEREDAKALGFSAREVTVISNLADGPLTPGELAALVDVKPATITPPLHSLTAKGLVSRTPDPADKRREFIALTAAGEEALQAIRQDSWLTGSLLRLTEAERENLWNVLPVLAKLNNEQDAVNTQ